MSAMKALLFAGVFLLAASRLAHAQPYSLDWATVDGGGGTISSNAYSLSGTVGQPEAGVLSGIGYKLEGGFWPGLGVLSTGSLPTLSVRLVAGRVVISWSPASSGFVLEQSDTLSAASWFSAPTGNPTVAIAPAGTARFYRLRKL